MAQSNSATSATVTGSGAGAVVVTDDTGDQLITSLDATTQGHLGRTKAFGTVEAGYDFQAGRSFVLGVMGNYNFAGGKRSNLNNTGSWTLGSNSGNLVDPDATNPAIDTSSPCPSGGADCTFDYFEGDHGSVTQQSSFRTKDSWGIGARAGYLASENTLIYLSGGFTQTKVDMALSAQINPSNHDYAALSETPAASRSFGISRRAWESGYFVGGGIETMLTGNVSAKLDYRYSDFGNRAISGSHKFDFPEIGDETLSLNVDSNLTAKNISTHSVRAVIAYRF